EAIDIIHAYGQALHALLEGLGVLQREDGGRHQHGHLPTVANRLEGRADGHFRLPDADVAADETIHGYGSFHVTLYIRSGLLLVGRVLIDEAGLEFVLQVAIGLESESRIALSFGVELDEVEGKRLHFRLRLFLEVLPRRTAQ